MEERSYLNWLFTRIGGTRQRSYLRHCAIRKVVGSIPDGVIGILHWLNPSGRTVTLGSTRPLTWMSTRELFLGKSRRCKGLKILPHSCAEYLGILKTPRAWLGLYKHCLTFRKDANKNRTLIRGRLRHITSSVFSKIFYYTLMYVYCIGCFVTWFLFSLVKS
jgi:hypothetical protein